MSFIDGSKTPAIAGTGSEDYFPGARDFGGKPFSYQHYGTPVVGPEVAGSRLWKARPGLSSHSSSTTPKPLLCAAVGAYTIRPHGPSEGKQCATIQAFVRTGT